MTNRFYLAPLFAAFAILAAWLADRAAKARRPDGDRGDLWVAVTSKTAFIGVAMAIAAMAQSFPAWWRTGIHPYLDLVLEDRWAFPLALAIPFLTWGAILITAVVAEPGGRERCNWLAGSIGYSATRKWLLLCAIPLAIPLFWVGSSRLDVGSEGYPAGTWGAVVALLISLCFLAVSTGKPLPATRAAQPVAAAPTPQPATLKPWPAAMADAGIGIEAVTSFGPPSARRKVSRQAQEFERRLELAGARTAAPEVIETVNDLLSESAGESSNPVYRLLFAPDNCGQVESIALAACDLAATHRECTLIVTRHPDPLLARRLQRWVQAAASEGVPQIGVVCLGSDTHLADTPAIWMVDAATLSDEFLARLSDRAFAGRIGMVVWWDIHEYTGVLAANLWAISRRFHRLIRAKGRPDVRTLVLVRDAYHAGSHVPAFVRRLLPYPFPPESEVHVEGKTACEVHVHLLKSQREYFERNEGIPSRVRHPELVAAMVSISQGWPTSLEAESQIPESERKEVVGKWVGSVSMREALRDDASESGARIMRLDESEALALREIVCQGGRAASADPRHHVAVTLPDNPYVAWVLDRLRKGREVRASRRLVGAEGHPSLFRRHLLLALSEQTDTRTGLMETLLWQEDVVERTLKEIAEQGKLSRQRVAFVAGGRRRMEYLYRSTLARDGEKRPLDVVGDATVLIRPATEGMMQPLWVDEKRLAIRAYPGRIFVENGARYLVRNWNRQDRRWIECERTPEPALTWRRRTPQVKRIQPKGEERTTGERGILTKYYPVTLQYEEDVYGYIRRDYDFTRGEHTDQIHTISALLTAFETTGFVIDFIPEPDGAALQALCQALRHIIPVHLGVEEDGVEIVPLEGEYVGRRQVFGLAIIDLYPQGIGLVEAICDDPSWTTSILKLSRDWLADICAANDGRSRPFSSPMARAATGGGEDPRAALELLRRTLGPEAEPAQAHAGGGF